MTNPIRITIKGNDAGYDDAPTVDDLLSQIQDFVALLSGVEEAIATSGKAEGKAQLVWRVTDVTKNSPITFEVTPYPETFGQNVEYRADQVAVAAAKGLSQISEGTDRPDYFTDKVIDKAERINQRVTNGLEDTKIDFCGYDDTPEFSLTREIAVRSIENIDLIRSPGPNKYRELGSIEGFIARIEIDGYGRPLIWLRSRLDRQFFKCISGEHSLDRIGHYEVSKVLKGMRVRVHGLVHYKGLQQIDKIEVDNVHVYPLDSELPTSADILAPNFTDGVESSDFLEVLRRDG